MFYKILLVKSWLLVSIPFKFSLRFKFSFIVRTFYLGIQNHFKTITLKNLPIFTSQSTHCFSYNQSNILQFQINCKNPNNSINTIFYLIDNCQSIKKPLNKQINFKIFQTKQKRTKQKFKSEVR